MVRLAALAGASAAVLASSADAFTVTIINACSGDIELYTRLASVYTDESETIASGASVDKTIEKGYEGHFRNGSSDAATLIEFATKGDLDLAWFDIGIIPPHLEAGFEYCSSLQECKDHSSSGIGFNTPVQVTPKSNTNGDNCREITCLADGCEDAYNYPKDDTKTHSCTFGTDFEVTFCPSGDASTAQQDQEQQEQQQTYSASTSASASQDATQQQTTEETPAPETTEAPATEAPATEAPATDAPVQQSSGSDAGKVHSQNEDVNGESETTAPDVTQAETPAPEPTPAVTPAATKSKFCV
ncbi:thaumatin-like protein [Phytophthora sojae]|uniref:Thaumatin-like protein n=1 Tax=Phytophthora sojae (strain P6497) TaxID=1094619 RepID=G4YEI7_PHYSP|nr:thaumatin-like protein [Phytophthora sojae]EGZ27264.1 thaumatin-like protein [Phytophthora sojae]|eukprot:XP_009514539.1 thaumatin-like protein [Phytophthora sojae]